MSTSQGVYIEPGGTRKAGTSHLIVHCRYWRSSVLKPDPVTQWIFYLKEVDDFILVAQLLYMVLAHSFLQLLQLLTVDRADLIVDPLQAKGVRLIFCLHIFDPHLTHRRAHKQYLVEFIRIHLLVIQHLPDQLGFS